MKKLVTVLMLLLPLCLDAQVDRKEVRAGNRKFRRGDLAAAELEYRKAAAKDSLSVAAWNNLGVVLSGKGDISGAEEAFERSAGLASSDRDLVRAHYNKGCIALDKKDYQSAVKEFKQVLLVEPQNMDAKEKYSYAKKMLQDQQGQNGQNGENGDNGQRDQDGSGGDDDQDQQQDQNKDQDQNQQPQQQPQDQDQQDKRDQQQPQQQQQISPRQAQQMLQAIQAKEKDTKDKVDREKAAAFQSRQKEKNW